MELRKFIATTIREYLNEELNHSLSTSNYDMVDILKSLPYIKYVDRPSGHFLHSIDLVINSEEYVDDLKSILDDNDWYIERGRERSFTISQKYIKDAEVKIPNKLYHITPTKYVDIILSNGLKPKSDDLRHKYPPRIYVSDNVGTLNPLSKELTRWKGDKEYSILEINTNGLDFKLYKDTTSAYKGHYYIQDIENIPSENIKLFK